MNGGEEDKHHSVVIASLGQVWRRFTRVSGCFLLACHSMRTSFSEWCTRSRHEIGNVGVYRMCVLSFAECCDPYPCFLGDCLSQTMLALPAHTQLMSFDQTDVTEFAGGWSFNLLGFWLI